MRQIERSQAIEILNSLDSKRYIGVIVSSGQSHIVSAFYIDENNNDFIIHLKAANTIHEYYFNIARDKDIKFLCELIKNREKVFLDSAMLYSYDENMYKNPEFIAAQFEIIDQHIEKRYGLFNKIKPDIILPECDMIRELTIDDINIIENFAKENEKHFPSYNLLNYIEELTRKSQNHQIYGYFRDDKLTAFVTIHAVNDNYWNIGYIFTSPQYRQNGMGLNLAKYFINEFIDKDAFISYGTAQNENSRKTARAVL